MGLGGCFPATCYLYPRRDASISVIGDQRVTDGNSPCPFSEAGSAFPPASLPVPITPSVPALGCINVASPRPRRAVAELGDIPFVIRRDGVWLYRGSPIDRKEMVCLFASVLRRDEAGGWWLRTPAERGRIVVEDAPFIAVELDWTGEGQAQTLSFRTNVDQVVTAGPNHPIRVVIDPETEEPTPYILVRPGDGALPIEARIGRAVYYEMVALSDTEVVDGREMLGVWSQGCFFPLGDMPAEDA